MALIELLKKVLQIEGKKKNTRKKLRISRAIAIIDLWV